MSLRAIAKQSHGLARRIATPCGLAMTAEMNFITFIAHGSKKEEANDFLKNLIRSIAPDDSTNLGFLELAPPNIPQALEAHIQKGAKTIRVIPLFLVPGRHLSEDIPAILTEISRKYPDLEIKLDDFIGNTKEFKNLLVNLIKAHP